jgi:hypothetical protein
MPAVPFRPVKNLGVTMAKSQDSKDGDLVKKEQEKKKTRATPSWQDPSYLNAEFGLPISVRLRKSIQIASFIT